MNDNFTSDLETRLTKFKKSNVLDFFMVLILSALAIILSLYLSSSSPDILYKQYDIWYGADINRVYDNLLNLHQFNDSRSHIHPIFSTLISLLITFLGLLGLESFNAIYVLIAISGALVTIALYITLRFNGLSVLSSSLSVCMFLSSGSYIFWWSILETFSFGAVTVAIVFLLLSAKVKSKWIWVLSSVLTLGITITNWFSSVLGVLFTFKRSQIKYILGLSFAIVAILYISRIVYEPNIEKNPSEIGMEFYHEGGYLVIPKSISEIPKYAEKYFVRGIFFLAYSGVSSEARLSNDMTKIESTLLNYSIYGWIAFICWLILFFTGLKENISNFKTNKLSKTLIFFVLFQFLMHLVYGDEPFLYSAHYIVPMIIIASFSFNKKRKIVYQSIAFIFCICAMINNLNNFENAILLITKMYL